MALQGRSHKWVTWSIGIIPARRRVRSRARPYGSIWLVNTRSWGSVEHQLATVDSFSPWICTSDRFPSPFNSRYATILAFDVKVERDAQELADSLGVKIFQADIIYHLFDKFMAYRDEIKQRKREEFKTIAVFPCKLKVSFAKPGRGLELHSPRSTKNRSSGKDVAV